MTFLIAIEFTSLESLLALTKEYSIPRFQKTIEDYLFQLLKPRTQLDDLGHQTYTYKDRNSYIVKLCELICNYEL